MTQMNTGIRSWTTLKRILRGQPKRTTGDTKPNVSGTTYYTPPTATTSCLPQDVTPESIFFPASNPIELSTLTYSNIITLSGTNWPTLIEITNGEYQINGGSWTSVAGEIPAGATLRLRTTSSSSINTSVVCSVLIGGVYATYSITTGDNVPNSFSFTPTSSAEVSTTTTSLPTTISGLTISSPVTVSGGEWRKNNGSWTSSSGTVLNGDIVQVRGTSSSSYSTGVGVSLTIGGISATFTITTRVADTTPNAISFTPVEPALLSTEYISNSQTITGIDIPASIDILYGSGEYSIDSGVWTSLSGTISNGQSIRLKKTSSASELSLSAVVVSINGVEGTFNITTGDKTPNSFTFLDYFNQPPSTLLLSEIKTISGITIPSPISASSGEYQINGGSWIDGATVSTVNNGDQVRLRLTSNATNSGSVSTIVNIGGVTDTWAIYTEGVTTTTTTTTAAPTTTTTTTAAPTTTTTTTAAPVPVNLRLIHAKEDDPHVELISVPVVNSVNLGNLYGSATVDHAIMSGDTVQITLAHSDAMYHPWPIGASASLIITADGAEIYNSGIITAESTNLASHTFTALPSVIEYIAYTTSFGDSTNYIPANLIIVNDSSLPTPTSYPGDLRVELRDNTDNHLVHNDTNYTNPQTTGVNFLDDANTVSIYVYNNSAIDMAILIQNGDGTVTWWSFQLPAGTNTMLATAPKTSMKITYSDLAV